MTSERRVDQLLAGFAAGDAISREALKIRSLLRGMGVAAEIFAPADRIAAEGTGDCADLARYRAAPGDVAVLHYSTSSPVSARFLKSPARKVLRYHNITPAEFYVGFDDGVAAQLHDARAELAEVAAGAETVWADSDFNAAELKALGIETVGVVPLFFSPEDLDVAPAPDVLRKYSGGLRNLLFVGRMAPNKCVEDLILAFGWLHRALDPGTRLILAGSERSCPRYCAFLNLLAGRLELANVCFEGFVSESGLAACYQVADVFVCASRHEGFCLPLLEAMCHGVPVVARDAGGMPEALGNGGVLFDEVEPRVLAGLIHRVLRDADLRKTILISQGKRVAQVRQRDLSADCERLIGLRADAA